MPLTEPPSLGSALHAAIQRAITAGGGWLPFDRYMAIALYEPGLGYYTRGGQVFGEMPSSGSDFVTAPELTPLFGHALSTQVAQALDASDTRDVWEFGAGTGALALSLLDAIGDRIDRYTIVDLSGSLRSRQQALLKPYAEKLRWLGQLPERFEGVIVGNEVLDAMPVQLLHFDGHRWFERGVAMHEGAPTFADLPTALRPPVDAAFVPGSVTELHAQAEAFIATLAERLTRGAAFFIDYGFPAHEYYLPERIGGTLMCHQGHRADGNPLADIGAKDITAHVDFTGIALAAQDAGLDVIGYTSQARFLLNCGLTTMVDDSNLRTIAAVQKLVSEHEMGELFKVIGLARGCSDGFTADPVGFRLGDRSHTL